jgi:hypothetical protein
MSKLYLIVLLIILSPLSIFNVQAAGCEPIAEEPSNSKQHTIRLSMYYKDGTLKEFLGENQRIIFLVQGERVGTISYDQMVPGRISINEALDISKCKDSVKIGWFIEKELDGGILPSSALRAVSIKLQSEGNTLKAVRLVLGINGGEIEDEILLKY